MAIELRNPAMFLVTVGDCQPITEKQRQEWEEVQRTIFPCDYCSTEQKRVFHNVFGKFEHQSLDELEPPIAEEDEPPAANPNAPATETAGEQDWPDPNEGSKPDLDLGGGHTLAWTKYEGQISGGIIRHTTPITEKTPLGYCDAVFWLRGNAFSVQHQPNSPQWDMTGGFEVPTLSPSFRCHCGDHGFIREGKWVPAG